MIKMKAQIKNVTIVLSQEILKSLHLPKNGECEIGTENNNEIVISSIESIPKNQIKILNSRLPTAPINEMIKNEEVDFD